MTNPLYSVDETCSAISCNKELLRSFNTRSGKTVFDEALTLAGQGYVLDEESAANLTRMSSLFREDNLARGRFDMSLPGLIRIKDEITFRLGS